VGFSPAGGLEESPGRARYSRPGAAAVVRRRPLLKGCGY
jgi:hypothetical protein